MDKQKPKKVKVGQIWMDKRGRVRVIEVVPGVGCHLWYETPVVVGGSPIVNAGWRDPTELLDDDGWTFVSGPGEAG